MGEENIDETYVDCSICDYKYVSYGESDIGYEEWSCELLEKFFPAPTYKNGGDGTCPCMHGEEERVCPLKVRYSVNLSE